LTRRDLIQNMENKYLYLGLKEEIIPKNRFLLG
jgi:hypothetical protein